MAVTGTTFTASGSTTSTATLRALGAQISAAIASAGMVQTSDTGQINWTTVNWATGAQTFGYEVWRFSDALQATKPFFVRLLYTQPASPNMLHLSAQVGTATDGAGTLTSAPSTGVSISGSLPLCQSGSSAAATAKPWYIYGDGSSLILAATPELMTATTTGYGGWVILERARDVDGSPLGDGLLANVTVSIAAQSNNQSVLHHNAAPQLGLVSSSGGWCPAPLTAGMPASGVFGSNMYVLPWFTGYTPRLGAPSKMVVGLCRTDMPLATTFTLQHYGASATFTVITPPAAYNLGMGVATGGTLLGLAIRSA